MLLLNVNTMISVRRKGEACAKIKLHTVRGISLAYAHAIKKLVKGGGVARCHCCRSTLEDEPLV